MLVVKYISLQIESLPQGPTVDSYPTQFLDTEDSMLSTELEEHTEVCMHAHVCVYVHVYSASVPDDHMYMCDNCCNG